VVELSKLGIVGLSLFQMQIDFYGEIQHEKTTVSLRCHNRTTEYDYATQEFKE
jgi:hypothetical protein